MIDLPIWIYVACKAATAKAAVAGTVKAGEVLGAQALANGGASAALLPHVAAGGTIAHAIGGGTLGVTGSVAHGAGAALSTAGVSGASAALGPWVLNEYVGRERANLEKQAKAFFGDFDLFNHA